MIIPDKLSSWIEQLRRKGPARRALILASTHNPRRKATVRAWLLAGALCLVGPGSALAMSANELFADGNRLFRDDLYWAALLRYSQAEEAGLDTPLLHYNSGVAHYRAQQYVRARQALLRAAEDPRLRAISHYNLGLNSYAAGDIDDALRWFREARDQQSNKKISALARKAIARLRRAPRAAEESVAVQAEPEKRARPLFDFDLNARISYGSDSNVYRSPSESYVDLSDPNTPTVDPIVQSGSFLPYDVRLKYAVNSLEHESFYGAYRLKGRLYQDEPLSNADEFRHELSFGSEYHRREESRERKVYSAFAIAQHYETYYDPDDGTERVVAGQNISDRMSYLRYGPEIWFRQSFDRFSFGGRLIGELWNYEDVEVVPEYDHEYILVGVNAQYKFTRSSLLRLNANAYTRRYGDRPGFELDGQQLLGNEPIEYVYLEASATARQRIGRSFWFGVDFTRTEREDKYLGYNNYSRDTYGLDVSWRPTRNFSVQASGYYRVYDYEAAFAFHDPAAGRKTLETTNASLYATFRIAWDLTLVAQYNFRDVESNDTRIAYDRSQYVLGVRWEY